MGIYQVHHVQLAMPPGGEVSAVGFYEGLLGLPRVPNGDVALHLGVEADYHPAHKAHPALLVEELVTLEETLRAVGAEVYRDQPLEGFDRCYVDDPFGNRIELMEPV